MASRAGAEQAKGHTLLALLLLLLPYVRQRRERLLCACARSCRCSASRNRARLATGELQQQQQQRRGRTLRFSRAEIFAPVSLWRRIAQSAVPREAPSSNANRLCLWQSLVGRKKFHPERCRPPERRPR